MLKSFRVANHKSIRDEQQLLLTSAYDKAATVVPVAAVFGANASGKSNLLDALRWMQFAVRGSYGRWEADSGIPRTAFRLDAQASSRPSTYVVDLVLDSVPHTYGFSVDEWNVLEEWLYSYPHKHKRVIFERSADTVEFGSTVPERKSRAELISSFMRNNSLLLSTAMQANQEEVAPVYRWFRRLRVVASSGYGRRSVSPALIDQVARMSAESPELVELLQVADLGISDIKVIETFEQPSAVERDRARRLEDELFAIEQALSADVEEATRLAHRRTMMQREVEQLLSARRRSELLLLHGNDRVALSLREQSDGTIAWLNLLVPVLTALRTGSPVVTDEIDASLHPRLSARLIELFRNPQTNPHGSQLIFTTHDATLLGTSFGRDILRRDEIWFVEKDVSGSTRLFPLTDFHPRTEENTERRYLNGSYGAVPAVFSDTLVNQLLATRTGDGSGTP